MIDTVAGCFQFHVLSGEVEDNWERVKGELSRMGKKDCRLAVLPEMWSCGFHYPQLRQMALESPHLLDRLKTLAEKEKMVIVGSLPHLDGDDIYNVAHVIDADGRMAGEYRKIHLFTHAGEHLHFSRGREALVCDTSVGRVGVMICYDLRFPELARKLALAGAEILCVPALWPRARIEHWSLLLRARALENQLFVLGCNGTGAGGGLTYGGRSAIVSPWGSVLAQGGEGEEWCQGILESREMEAFRNQIPCFQDRLPGVYGIV